LAHYTLQAKIASALCDGGTLRATGHGVWPVTVTLLPCCQPGRHAIPKRLGPQSNASANLHSAMTCTLSTSHVITPMRTWHGHEHVMLQTSMCATLPVASSPPVRVLSICFSEGSLGQIFRQRGTVS